MQKQKLYSFAHPDRVDVGVDCSLNLEEGRGGADQSFAKACDINHIMAQYQKTNMLPHVSNQIPQYIDNTEIMDYGSAFNFVRKSLDLFRELPAEIRKEMDNKPENLPEFLSNPKNHDLCVKHGLFTDSVFLRKEKELKSQEKIETLKKEVKAKPEAAE